ncbi:glycoside hydrolase family 3 C-terminal domain-containing protein [Oxalobacteraceae bacterium]|nr:glycoside hydrolase family 3 C-terminal domain-containing protein [Oxalobacteraceae bacterium]
MTLDEKIQLVHGAGIGTSPLGGGGFIPGIARLGIPDLNMADSATGVNAGLKGATEFPSPLAVAASWNGALANELGATIAKELRATGFAISLGSGGANLAREPRYGRTWEYFGEDPVLAGTFMTQRTLGTQAQKVIATAKHFIGNEQETNRFASNSVIPERALRELYLLPFEMTVKDAQPGNVMCAYNLVNGLKACESKELLTDILKTQWGFKGTVQADWIFALTDTVRGANAGLDEEEPGSQDDYQSNYGLPTSNFNQKLKAAVQNGSVSAARLDDMVFRKLRTLYRYGIMDTPPVAGGTIDRAGGQAMAQKVASEAMVLLKNAAPAGTSSPALPIAKTIRSIVVIGGHADVGVMHGGGSASIAPQDGNPVACLQPGTAFDPAGVFSKCAPYFKSSPLAAIRAKAPNASVTYFDGSNASAAAAAAASADVAIVFATQFASENMDLATLDLPNNAADPANQAYDQNALIAAVTAKNKRTVVVLESATAVTMPWLAGTSAVLEAWYPGIRGGQAIADVLFGDVNPSGKLPITFPQKVQDLPQPLISQTDTTVNYAEGLNMGYRWFDSKAIAPLFPFGHGLSYTSFSYSGLIASKLANGDVSVRVTLKNDGVRAGAEVAQVYATLPSAAGEPPKRLVGWQKVLLQPGESRQLSITISSARFAIWNTAQRASQVPAGSYGVQVGGSSRAPAMLSTSLSL